MNNLINNLKLWILSQTEFNSIDDMLKSIDVIDDFKLHIFITDLFYQEDLNKWCVEHYTDLIYIDDDIFKKLSNCDLDDEDEKNGKEKKS